MATCASPREYRSKYYDRLGLNGVLNEGPMKVVRDDRVSGPENYPVRQLGHAILLRWRYLS